ncbi:unnamed protein product [Bursaphelenchus okinawaensis]|uniref:Uncharacterized protein n=1 Tax=Bursaphelenchus okinawaensis TaxID=465554 RepID=A0A811LI74_9BILA|nr:unnamed protein product [Bursaphelenchus okinawaensis]CAG9123709.1 unnamed protein product [Bursaphelenchus okinawaensis]
MAATTSSCIQKRTTKLESRRICFTQEPPSVFEYPDENCTMEWGEWRQGHPISYDEYQRIVQAASDEAQAQLNQLARWRQQMQMKFVDQEQALENAVQQLNQTALISSQTSSQTSSKPTDNSPPRFTFNTSSQPPLRRECGTSAI